MAAIYSAKLINFYLLAKCHTSAFMNNLNKLLLPVEFTRAEKRFTPIFLQKKVSTIE